MASSRLTFLDLLRGGAALVMIEVHVVNAFLMPSVRDAAWFPALNYLNGLVAPAFLFAAGFAFALTSDRAERNGAGDRRPRILKSLRRIGLVLASGYLLHLPGYGWSKMAAVSETGWLRFVQADILHTIAVGLVLLLLAREFLGGVKGLIRTAALIGTGSSLIAPWTWLWDAQSVFPAPIASYVNGTPYSQFPLFPWLAFLMAGAVTAALYPKGEGNDAPRQWNRRVGWIGLALVVVAGLLRWSEVGVALPQVHIRANPWFVAERLGALLVILSLLGSWSLRRSGTPFILRDVSRESLQVYVAHLMIIYGDWIDGSSLAYHYKQRFDLVSVAGITVALMAAMVLTAWGWQTWKRASPESAHRAFYAAVAVGTVVFFLR
ncbi:MAG: heparan-alpha-glucosaminide N-acetyltransferase domain-containing protein [Bacteroidota bacterium]|mgnify:CR=1 FL=1